MKMSEFEANHIVYFTIMQSKKVYIKGSEVIERKTSCSFKRYICQLYAWETGPVEDMALFLLCGEHLEIKVGPPSRYITDALCSYPLR